MKTIVTPAILTAFSSRADKSLGFRGVTPELSSVEKAAFMDLQGINVRLLIEPVDFESDGKSEVRGVLDSKPPSQRLRNALFVFWKQQTEHGRMKDKDFDSFYTERMNFYIDDVKSKLEPE